ncbi:class I SAM-dependent methyltransferase [Nocardia yunnanensis]|uniref:Class I SAM-dependent methyltransferase n=1 Tax=Nocardia yunnanensis TaxID=2382165 RepID=A0A386ZEM2_9NOCA|nr:class I SAM-dependent methyltransferase [Nocardia yunnanensis]AYF75564.1 class I SAM-dependent methyltransferase [Nocardia yunnanensis]
MDVPDDQRWNHNIEYHSLLAEAVADAKDVLDVGCGEGQLARRIRRSGAAVTGIDPDPVSIELARAQSAEDDITYLRADFLEYPFEPNSFDGIVSIAALHHMDSTRALTRMRELLRPGGTLALIGMARNGSPRDLPWEAAALLTSCKDRLFRTQWPHPSPVVWPPPETYGEIRRRAADLLPGVRYRRHLLWRYSLVWTKPDPAAAQG